VIAFLIMQASFAGAPHACLGYANAGSSAGTAFERTHAGLDSEQLAGIDGNDIKRQLFRWFPELLDKPVPVVSIGLWSTQGQTTQWTRVTPISQQIHL